MRAAHPLVAIRDDHEVEDNDADGRPGGGARAEPQISFAERKRNGYRAFFEHLARAERRGDRIDGSIPPGAAKVLLLDTRRYRDDQPCNPDDSFVPDP